jgi:Xaa-Pro aminopeptidase
VDLARIQSVLAQRGFDAWLFYDHHHRDPIAYRVLGLPEQMPVSRRWFYVVPARGTPKKLVHRVEPEHLDSLPGTREIYSGWRELADQLRFMLAPFRSVAMQYSPNNLIFYVGMVDAGTVELVRSFGHKIVSSGDLVAYFEAALSDEQIRAHFQARDKIDTITAEAFEEIGRRVRDGGATEYDIQQWIMQAFLREALTTAGDKPVVAVNEHSSIPHYAPAVEHSAAIQDGDFVLLDIWAKENTPEGVFYDITWTGCVGQPSARQREIFAIVKDARDLGVVTVRSAVSSGRRIAGWEVDRVVRDFITRNGYGEHFIHRTGHSIGAAIHANGANMDDLEIKDEREIIPNTCFSVEPGIYMPEFGVRSEVNVLVREGSAEVTGRIQTELVII